MEIEGNAATDQPTGSDPQSLEQVQQPDNATVDQGTTDPQQAGEQQQGTQGEQQGGHQPEPWVTRRFAELTRQRYDAERRAQELEARLASGATTTTDEQPGTRTPQTQADFDRAVSAAVDRRTFDEACNRVFQQGMSESPDFQQAVGTLQMMGVMRDDVLQVVTQLDNAPKVLRHLAATPADAERLLSLPPMQMAMELGRMSDRIAKPSTQTVSKAPAPISPIAASPAAVEPAEFASTDEYVEFRRRQLAKR
ncbi:hypothetical protein [Burkholderia cenocepacia]|uniref:hypothetical protein n=1 Tax=Burkholderia cenocepacia TaxID=95486 RepID=UPI00223775F0|nr:hypothetical protein [Burkholderia cenocepacia]MCW5141066.1 hypothetical protein [Burkholderia cenocepacia]